jgi:hypothetical protein
MRETGSHGGAACREVRPLLGVYVVGAIDPADRSIVDTHLGDCQACRDELAGLAGLPAMLGRVPATDVERMDQPVAALPGAVEPSAELLDSLLARVASRRARRRWRSIAAVAAAAAIAAGGATAAVQLTRPSSPNYSRDVYTASAASASTHAAAVVDYAPTAWGTAMRVQVRGIAPGTACQFWVLTKSGRDWAGGWKVSPYYPKGWYPASSKVGSGSVRGFEITAGSRVLLEIPAN